MASLLEDCFASSNKSSEGNYLITRGSGASKWSTPAKMLEKRIQHPRRYHKELWWMRYWRIVCVDKQVIWGGRLYKCPGCVNVDYAVENPGRVSVGDPQVTVADGTLSKLKAPVQELSILNGAKGDPRCSKWCQGQGRTYLSEPWTERHQSVCLHRQHGVYGGSAEYKSHAQLQRERLCRGRRRMDPFGDGLINHRGIQDKGHRRVVLVM